MSPHPAAGRRALVAVSMLAAGDGTDPDGQIAHLQTYCHGYLVDNVHRRQSEITFRTYGPGQPSGDSALAGFDTLVKLGQVEPSSWTDLRAQLVEWGDAAVLVLATCSAIQ